MKKLLQTALYALICLLPLCLEAQIPQGIHYQGILRDDNGAALPNRTVGVRFTIIRSATNNIVYRETQTTSTNEFGLMNMVIGRGTVITGRFLDIEWERGGLRIRVEADPNGGNFYQPFGETDLQSTPYAFAAETALNLDASGKISTGQINGGSAQNGQILRWNGTTWSPSNESAATLSVSPRFSGTGSAGSPLELAAQGAQSGQVLKWNGTNWAPGADQGVSYTEGAGIQITGSSIAARNTQALWNANQLRGRNVSENTPQSGQLLQWDGFTWTPTTVNTGLTLPYDGAVSDMIDPALRVTNPVGVGIHGRGQVGLRGTYLGTGAGYALELTGGGIRVTGSNKPAFQLNGVGNIEINSPLCNNNPNAMIFVTQINPNPNVNDRAYPFSLNYNFQQQRWYILSDPGVSLTYNILIVNQ